MLDLHGDGVSLRLWPDDLVHWTRDTRRTGAHNWRRICDTLHATVLSPPTDAPVTCFTCSALESEYGPF